MTKTANVTLYSSMFLHQSSVNEFSISVHNMDRFLLHKQFAKEILSRVTVKNLNPEAIIELWWNDAIKPSRLVDAYRPNQSN